MSFTAIEIKHLNWTCGGLFDGVFAGWLLGWLIGRRIGCQFLTACWLVGSQALT